MRKKHLRRVGFAALAACNVAFAQQVPVKLDIAAQPLDKALNSWANQTGYQVLVPVERVARGRTAPSIKGTYTPEGALKILLASSDLKYQFVNARTVTIRAPEATPAADHPPAAPAPDNSGQKSENDSRFTLAQSHPRTEEAVATETETSGGGGAPTNKRMEEVLVTAQKRSERLIDTPQSVSVLSTDSIEKLGATQFRDFANTVPGLNFNTQGAGYTRVSMRGVTTGVDVSPTVGIYMDEIPYGSSTFYGGGAFLALDVGLFDINRIEVLRGPQGTLYGASSMGGLIKYVTREPDPAQFDARVQTGISGTQDGGTSYQGAGMVNVPLVSDKAALRVNGFYSRDGGYVSNLALNRENVNRADVYGGRVDLLLQPTNAFNIRITGVAQNISRDGKADADYSLAGVPVSGELDQRRVLAEPFDQHFRVISATLGYDFGPAILSAISGYQTTEVDYDRDLSPIYVPLLNSSPAFGGPYSAIGTDNRSATDRFTQEVRLASNEAQTFEWVFGGFYSHEKSNSPASIIGRTINGSPLSTNVFHVSLPSLLEEYAAFGDLTWHITDAFDVTGGLRYARDRQTFTQAQTGLLGAFVRSGESKDHVTTYLANARYRVGTHAMGYLRYATGYRPGGANFAATNPITGAALGPPIFESDALKSYEAGFKAETADGRLGFDLAVYHSDWDDIQISVVRSGFSFITNAPGGATVNGAELVLTARPVQGFSLTSAFAYQDPSMNEADPPVLPSSPNGRDLMNRKGERLPDVPRFTAALNADYTFLSVGVHPTFGATVRHIGDRTSSFDASTSRPQYHLPSYTTFDLRGGLMLGSINTQLYIHNLSDKRGQLSASTFAGLQQIAIMQPRTYGVTLSCEF